MFRKSYASVFEGDERWNSIDSPEGEKFAWDDDSTYIQNPPYFEGMTLDLPGIPADPRRALPGAAGRLDHHRPHLARPAAIKEDSPAGEYLQSKGVQSRPTSTPTARAAATTR
jgi:aconitate hydratase